MKLNQRGSALVVALCFIGFLVVVCGVLAMSYISAFNQGNQKEQAIKATYANNENVLAQYGQKVVEASQVPEMARDDMMKIAREAIGSRYGEDGSKAVFQMLREQNPQVDPQLYRQIQQIIESGRDEFKNSQTRLIDQKRDYETALGSFWTGMWLRVAGYPKINLDDYKVISTDRAQDAFKKGKESAPIQLRPAKE